MNRVATECMEPEAEAVGRFGADVDPLADPGRSIDGRAGTIISTKPSATVFA